MANIKFIEILCVVGFVALACQVTQADKLNQAEEACIYRTRDGLIAAPNKRVLWPMMRDVLEAINLGNAAKRAGDPNAAIVIPKQPKTVGFECVRFFSKVNQVMQDTLCNSSKTSAQTAGDVFEMLTEDPEANAQFIKEFTQLDQTMKLMNACELCELLNKDRR